MDCLRSLIVDDDKLSRDLIELLIEKFCPEISILAKCHSTEQAKAKLESNEIDLLFLDVEMSNQTGFDLLECFPERNFQVIFITAYDEYAFRAFKVNAIDYLLKPLSKDKFIASVQKAVDIHGHKINDSIENPNLELENNFNGLDAFLLSGHRGAVKLKYENICYLEASNNYSIIYMKDGSEFVASKTLKDFESLLNHEFLRVHKSYLVNKHCILSYHRSNGIQIQLESGAFVPVSRRKQGLFLNQYMSH